MTEHEEKAEKKTLQELTCVTTDVSREVEKGGNDEKCSSERRQILKAEQSRKGSWNHKDIQES